MVGAAFLGEFGLVLRTDGADHVGAEIVRPLAGDETDAAGGGMDEHVVALLHLVGTPQQVLHRHALEHHAGGLFVADLVRQLHRPVGWQQPLGRIGPERRHIADAIADLDVADPGPDGDDFARPLIAGDERQPDRRGIHAAAEIGVDEIDAAGVVFDLDLTGTRRRH